MIDFANIFVILFLIGTFFQFGLNMFLEFVDYKYRSRNGRIVPAELEGYLSAEELDKTCRYEDAKYFYWLPKSITSLAVSLALVLSGFYPWVFEGVWSWCGRSFVTMFLFAVLTSIPSTIIDIPFDLYKQFKLEKKFGFSTMTVKLWIMDQIKGILVSLVLTALLLFIMVFFLDKTGGWWWLLLGAAYTILSLGLSIIYPLFIAPLFNKFTPLEEGELKNRLEELLSKCGFKASGLFVMDASKRSKHSNAYFTGFGKSKRVVLYDTLVEQLSPAEIEAVLGHELGHFKKHHIIKRMVVMIPLIFAVLFVINLFISNGALYSGFGFDVSKGVLPHLRPLGLFLMMIVFGGYGDIFSPVSNYFSRKDEFEADAYAKMLCGTGEHLSTGLIKLNKENLSEITPPKIYSVFNYSHPPLLERIRALEV